MVKVVYDEEKCRHPEKCLKCVEVCPHHVLMLAPKEKPKSPGTPPSRYIIYPVYDLLCDGCMKCVEVCAAKAIKIIK